MHRLIVFGSIISHVVHTEHPVTDSLNDRFCTIMVQVFMDAVGAMHDVQICPRLTLCLTQDFSSPLFSHCVHVLMRLPAHPSLSNLNSFASFSLCLLAVWVIGASLSRGGFVCVLGSVLPCGPERPFHRNAL